MTGPIPLHPEAISRERPSYPRSVTFFATGTEGFGIRRCLVDMADGFAGRGIAISFVLQVGEGRFADILRARGWPFEVVSARPLPLVRQGKLGKLASLAARALRQPRAARVLARHVKSNGSDAILLCSPPETLAAAMAARWSGRTAFWMMPNEVTDYPLDLNRRVYRAILRHGNLVALPNSHFTDRSLGPGHFRRRVCHLGIDPAEFDPEADTSIDRSGLGIPDQAIVIGLFARMVANKGQLQLIRAIAAMGDTAANVHLIMCGGPQGTDYTEMIDSEAQALGIAGRVHNLGEQDDMAGYYQLCDIIANSRLDPEPFGLSVVEGMMLGKPVFAHRAGGPSETMVDGETGWLIVSPDQADFNEGLRRALADREHWPALGVQGRQRALDQFTAAKMVDRVLDAMRELR